MASLFFMLVFALPLLALGGFLVWLSSVSLWSYLFGGQRDDPFQWPEVAVTVTDHRVESEFRGNRINVNAGPEVEKVNVYVRVQLPDGYQAEVLPAELANLAVAQPPGVDFHTFMRNVNTLALAQAREVLPPGSQVMVRADPERRGYAGGDGQHWTSASDHRTTASKPVSIAVMVVLMGFGVGLLLWGGTLLASLISAPSRH